MGNPRTIEVFTAGCALCEETLELVREATAPCSCEVVERRCEAPNCCEEAKAYGVRAVPTIVADSVVLFEGRPTRAQAIALPRRCGRGASHGRPPLRVTAWLGCG